jgi:uncharacterized ferritin-like protein (DUF455 family)
VLLHTCNSTNLVGVHALLLCAAAALCRAVLCCAACSLVHIELAAVDLSWDIIVRFGTNPSYKLPKAFFDDFVQVSVGLGL